MSPISYDLKRLGVPQVYWSANPYALPMSKRLDAFPSLGNINELSTWTGLVGDPLLPPDQAWVLFITSYIRSCSGRPFVRDPYRFRSANAIRSFVSIHRKRVRNYLDPLNLTALPWFSSRLHVFKQSSSWMLRSEALVVKQIDGIEIGQALVREHKWIRTRVQDHYAANSWYHWCLPGVSRVGWSSSNVRSWLWYEIRCPVLPLGPDPTVELSGQDLVNYVNSLWVPITRTLRFWSTSNPKLWNF